MEKAPAPRGGSGATGWATGAPLDCRALRAGGWQQNGSAVPGGYLGMEHWRWRME